MARVTSRRQLEIYECKTDDGGVGLKFGDGPLFMGYDGADLMRLLGEIFIDHGNAGGIEYDDDPIDGDLYDLAHTYLDEAKANERMDYLRRGY